MCLGVSITNLEPKGLPKDLLMRWPNSDILSNGCLVALPMRIVQSFLTLNEGKWDFAPPPFWSRTTSGGALLLVPPVKSCGARKLCRWRLQFYSVKPIIPQTVTYAYSLSSLSPTRISKSYPTITLQRFHPAQHIRCHPTKCFSFISSVAKKRANVHNSRSVCGRMNQ